MPDVATATPPADAGTEVTPPTPSVDAGAAKPEGGAPEGGKPTETPEAGVKPTDKPEGSAADGEQPDRPDIRAVSEKMDKLNKELGQRTKALMNMQAENKRLKEQLETGGGKQERPSQQADGGGVKPHVVSDQVGKGEEILNHPAVAGLRRNFDSMTGEWDGTVNYKGVDVTPEYVIDQYELREGLRAVQSTLSERDKAQKLAELQANEDQAWEEVKDTTTTKISKIRESLYPGLPEASATRTDDRIQQVMDNKVAAMVTDAIKAGNYTADMLQGFIDEAVIQAFEEYEEDTGHLGHIQFQNNRKFAETHKGVGPVGHPGTPKTTMPESPMERSQRARETAARLMKESG